MNSNFFTYSIKNLGLYSKTENKKSRINSLSPLKTENFSSSLNPIINYTNKRYKSKIAKSLTNKGFISPDKKNNNFYTLFINTKINSKKKSKIELPKISLSYNKNSKDEKIKPENSNIYLSLIKILKNSPKKNRIKGENLFFMKEKKSEIENIHQKLMNINKLNILTKQRRELSDYLNYEEEKKKKKNIKNKCLTEENKILLENEYKTLCKNKLIEKNLILKEFIRIGKKLSWINDTKIKEGGEDEKDQKEKIKKEIANSFFSKSVKSKYPVFEINQTSTLPIIIKDKPLTSDLWKKDMMKYCQYTLNNKNEKDIEFGNDLLDVYNL